MSTLQKLMCYLNLTLLPMAASFLTGWSIARNTLSVLDAFLVAMCFIGIIASGLIATLTGNEKTTKE